MKIKFFRQKRQAAEEKRKEERSALETVRMEYLKGLRLLIIYCHWSGREEAEGGGEGGGEGLGPHEDCQGAGAAVRGQHRGYGRYLHKNDAVNGYDIVDVSDKQKQIDKVCWEMSKFLIMSKLCRDLW